MTIYSSIHKSTEAYFHRWRVFTRVEKLFETVPTRFRTSYTSSTMGEDFPDVTIDGLFN